MSTQSVKCILISLLVAAPFLLLAQNKALHERHYADYIQELLGGQREFSVTNGRVDLVTEEYAYEIEWAKNWKEAIGQSLWYALQTGLKPGIILIRVDPKEYRYFQMLNSTLQFSNLEKAIRVLIFPDDFENLIEEK
ncbi:hypothetical protein KUV50_06895 [Membranicola marinus]|uniref:Uncharacterized protein n=1 Tax=Membranihabitans marinus TaxID=1227546 RepID=A0A953HL02_9BACT|nr:hypothetical protein [Membranihabitans marinus]MBY5957849.1 hypothetical protein [Membranihabitans marinus]